MGGNKNGKQGNECEEGGEDAGGVGGVPGGWFIWEDAVNVVVAVSCVHGASSDNVLRTRYLKYATVGVKLQ